MASASWDSTVMDRLANEILSQIELYESRLLAWGFIDVRDDLTGALPSMLNSLSSLGKKLWEEAQHRGVTLDDVIENLIERKLIFRSNLGHNVVHVSRFAAAIRLFFLLRQRFSPNDWQTANRLVSDMRVSLQRRRYPERSCDAVDLLNELAEMGVEQVRIQAIQHLLYDSAGQPLLLARFQHDAIVQQIRNLQGHQDKALVIGAGTGSGKTKAFYIPALAEIAATISNTASVKVLALYPRVELLKDQLQEAFSESRKLDQLLSRKRPILVGAYYGDTPANAQQLAKFRLWPETKARDGWICPYFACPNEDCHAGDMVWSNRDRDQEEAQNIQGKYGHFARLRCAQCGMEVGSDRLLLTRDQLIRQPPDLLFTTTEMLNRRLSRTKEHGLFGLEKEPPRLLLLDEIHTYEGLTGTQVAYLLRRWRYARSLNRAKSLCIVGLSATLTQAEHFFAQLTGIPSYNVDYIFPHDRDLIDEGMEYNLVLKGDPVSSTSLLSTSVQTAMLLGRVLDSRRPPSPAISRGAIGLKTFAFTDKLDVINRWYHIESDAETHKTLAQYRRSHPNVTRLHNQLGQVWSMCEAIGHDLRSPLILDLTSSQYRGVDRRAELVIATSTLEVGFNDPDVGAVLQHKAPRSMASFLQRKGRAGRQRNMRPWTVVVTSAYGRDRWAFQHAEQLFAPTLPPIELPLENTYICKIQATFALMDWLALEVKQHLGNQAIDIWQALTNNGKAINDQSLFNVRQHIGRILEAVVVGQRRSLELYLLKALGLPNQRSLDLILWGEPRPLLTEVIPTIIRRIESNWQRIEQGKSTMWTDMVAKNPLPDFLPANLFTDLNLPELLVRIPRLAQTRQQQSRDTILQEYTDEMMPIVQAMNEFAPGNVTKRFAHKDRIQEAHWVALPAEAQLSRGVLPIEYLPIEFNAVPSYSTIHDQTYTVYRPYAFVTSVIPSTIKSTSSSRLIWRSSFLPGTNNRRAADEDSHQHHAQSAILIPLIPQSTWGTLFDTPEAYLHSHGSWVEIARLAVGVNIDTRYSNGSSRRRTLMFEEGSSPAALGFTLTTDTIRVPLRPFDAQTIVDSPEWPRLYRTLNTAYVLDQLKSDIRLSEAGLSSFEIEWLWQLELSMVVAIAVSRQISLASALTELQSKRTVIAIRTLDVIFQTIAVDDDDDHDLRGRLHSRLLEYLDDPLVVSVLNSLTPLLWTPDTTTLLPWLEATYQSSLGSAIFATITRLIPDIDPDELVLDVNANAVWISEATSGGIGIIEKITTYLLHDPYTFDIQMLDTVQHCDTQMLANQLSAVAALLVDGRSSLDAGFSAIRTSNDIPTLNLTRKQLIATLESHGIAATRELVVSINSKFLRVNSAHDTDQLLGVVVQCWQTETERLGIPIDMRVFAVTAPKIPVIQQLLQTVLIRMTETPTVNDESLLFNLLQSLLWVDCTTSCPNCIHAIQRYQDLPVPSRGFVLAMVTPYQPLQIRFNQTNWVELVQLQLSSTYRVEVCCSQPECQDCHTAVLELLTKPIEIGFQFFYPTIGPIKRHGTEWIITLVISELLQRGGLRAKSRD